MLQLDHAVYQALTVGALSAATFGSGTDNSADLAATRIVYNQLTGGLFYDADGNGPGSAAQFAVLANHPAALSAGDLLVV